MLLSCHVQVSEWIHTLASLIHIYPVWLNGQMFVYELSGCGFESRCFHSNLPCHIVCGNQTCQSGDMLFGVPTYKAIQYISHVVLWPHVTNQIHCLQFHKTYCRRQPLNLDSCLPKNCFNCFNESPLKLMENAFYFILIAFYFILIVLKIFKVSSCRKKAWLEG